MTSSAKKLLGAFTDAVDAVGADAKLVNALKRVREEVIPDLEALVRDADGTLERLLNVRDRLRSVREEIIDTEIVEEKE